MANGVADTGNFTNYQPDLGIRKADSHKFGALLGDEEDDMESMPAYQENYDMIGGGFHHQPSMPMNMGVGPQLEE
jgi:hypothetical protein